MKPFEEDWPITQKYGDTITSSFHTGIDYGCPEGTRILAVADGIVKFAGEDKTGYGKYVIIQHNDKESTLYAHLSMILVYNYEYVHEGECIGFSGNTGHSTGPHLHFEARQCWNDYRSHFNPDELSFIPSKSKLTDAKDLKKGEVIVTAPAGVFLHNDTFTYKVAVPYGTKMNFTGNVKEHNGLEYCECELKVWAAVNDGETQILKNTGDL